MRQFLQLSSLSSGPSALSSQNTAFSSFTTGTMQSTASRATKLTPATLPCGRDGMETHRGWYGMSPSVGGARCTWEMGGVSYLIFLTIAIWRKSIDTYIWLFRNAWISDPLFRDKVCLFHSWYIFSASLTQILYSRYRIQECLNKWSFVLCVR